MLNSSFELPMIFHGWNFCRMLKFCMKLVILHWWATYFLMWLFYIQGNRKSTHSSLEVFPQPVFLKCFLSSRKGTYTRAPSTQHQEKRVPCFAFVQTEVSYCCNKGSVTNRHFSNSRNESTAPLSGSTRHHHCQLRRVTFVFVRDLI